MTNDLPAMPWPRWMDSIVRLLPIRSQFLVSGNIRDVFLTPTDDGEVLMPIVACLWERLRLEGFEAIVLYDIVNGISIVPEESKIITRVSNLLQLQSSMLGSPQRLENLASILGRIVRLREARIAAVVDFASRLVVSPNHLDGVEQRFFTALEKLCITASPLDPFPPTKPLHNPVIWLFNRIQDVPSWFVLDSQRASSISVPTPDYETRLKAAAILCQLFGDGITMNSSDKEKFVTSFADGSDGMTLQNLSEISQLANQRKLFCKDVDDAITAFKVGILESPWKKDYLRKRIAIGVEAIETRVKGQRQAVIKTIDILTRSVVGLTGAQAKRNTGRPRGVLFFAGPTGVGKTELAKALTQLIFGDERAYIRFDMSEFASEHSSERLLGAPPGYVGYDAGGELTNAIRERPFSVVLFDEIEKCHPRLLDKFLQILEDGRLTDGRGETVYFSESILVFTSNLGVFAETDEGERIQQVLPTDAYDQVERKIRESIGEYFKYRLGRPELLNRIGDNIVVFNFISSEIAGQILNGMLCNVSAKVFEEHKVRLEIAEQVRERLYNLCTEDLSNGGRGIGNRLESVFINPLARAIFDTPPRGTVLQVTNLIEQDRIYSVAVQCE